MKAYRDHNSRYFIKLGVEDGLAASLPPITRKPRIAYAKALPISAVELEGDDAAWVLVGFLDTAQHLGGDSLAIHHLKEIFMAKSKGFFAINLVALAVVHLFAFEKEAKAAVEKEGDPCFGLTVISDEAEFNKLSVEQKCGLARPLLNEKEAAELADGPGLADIACNVLQRFKNPKPVKGSVEKPGKEGKETKAPAEPRAKGVKTLIFDHFTANKDTAHLTTEEIMALVNGTKSSVTTAISDLRSAKYAGKQGTMNLVRVNGKYALEGSAIIASEAAKEAETKAAAEKEAAEKKEAAKKAKAEKEAEAKAAADAKTAAEGAKATA
jgi:hypothetical protein